MNSKENSTTGSGGARISLNLIDAIDLLAEARQVNQAAFMACASIHNRQHQEALQQVLSLCGETLRNVSENLDALRAEAREGGAA
ncbi:hypothetical protein [Devosia sp.]|uniref:hypothetical protein n=1 Tax=Devosia sp. TaxID=1871048 RepID=UPI001AD038B8|nr:hypothetical protein [Devosia sp.]MBN9334910.1 hypothetical protein [Devosia sp.]